MAQPAAPTGGETPLPPNTWSQRLHGLFPGLASDLRPWTRANFIAGLTVTTYLVPQVMAYTTIAGLPPITGLWACLPALVVYAFMGSSRLLSIGPESSMALMTAAVIGPLALGDPGRYAAAAAGLAIAVGVICWAASVLHLSFIGDLLSRPVLAGYMTGIAILMIDSQIDDLLGVAIPDSDNIGERVTEIAGAIPEADPAVVLLSASTLVMLFAFRRFLPRWPGPLLAVLIATLVAQLMARSGSGVPNVGAIPSGLPLPDVPAVGTDLVGPLLVAAVGLSVVSFTDVTLTGRAFRVHGDPYLRPDAELRALGTSNLATGFLQGMPVSSSGSRTALARESGASGQGYGLAVAALLVLVLVFLGPALELMPLSALAALVVYAAIRLVDVPELRFLWKFRRVEFLLAVVTAAGVLLLGVLYGVLVAVGVSVLAMLAQVARPHSAALGFVPDMPGMHDVGDFPVVDEEPGLLIFRYDSPLFFGNAEDFRTNARALVAQRTPGLQWLALNCEAIVEVDSTGVGALQGMLHELQRQDVRLVLVRAKRELIESLAATGFIDEIGAQHVYPTLPTLVKAYRARPDGRQD